MQDKTLFIIAHRLATVQASDRILLLEEKQLLAVGSHAVLLRDNSYYQLLEANQRIFTGSEPIAETLMQV